MLSRKHYITIARVIKDNSKAMFVDDGYNLIESIVINKDDLINDLCEVFANDNNLFNSDRFIDACNDD